MRIGVGIWTRAVKTSAMKISAVPATAVAVVMVVVMVMGLGCAFAPAAHAAPTAQQVLDSVEGTGLLAGSGRAVIEMIVEKGKQRKAHRLEVFRVDNGKGTSKQMVEFLLPADVKGTKFLSITEPGADDQMWLYLPAVGRERRIAGSAVQGQFMGTDFTFEEISMNENTWKAYTPALAADQKIDGKPCYVVKLTPKGSGVSYTSVVLYVWQEASIPLKIEFFGKGSKLQKVMTFSDIKPTSKGVLQPNIIALKNASSGSVTTVKIVETDERPVSDDVFSLRYLRK